MDALEMSLLYDYYGGLLTGKQRQCFDLRYNQDLSLGEIAQVMGVSRQAVSDNLTRTEALLRKWRIASAVSAGISRTGMRCGRFWTRRNA